MKKPSLLSVATFLGLSVAVAAQAAIIAVHDYPQMDTPGVLTWAFGTYAGLGALGVVTLGTLAFAWTQGRWPVQTRLGWSLTLVVSGAVDVWVAMQPGELGWVLYIAGLVHLFCLYGLLVVENEDGDD